MCIIIYSSSFLLAVTNLDYAEYEFRVRAKNRAGLSEHSNPLKVEVKPAFTGAGAPSEPKVDEVGKNHVTLSWSAPKSDGGARIIGYNIEARQGLTGPWVKLNDYPVSETSYTAANLAMNQSYEFRTMAVNKAGSGEASKPTAPVTPKDPDGRFYLISPPQALFLIIESVSKTSMFIFLPFYNSTPHTRN